MEHAREDAGFGAAAVDAHPDRPVRFVGEPIWAGQNRAETAAATRHEALINLAFAGSGAQILCRYDTRRLDPAVLTDAERTHPHLPAGAEPPRSGNYADPTEVVDGERWPLDPAPHGTPEHAFDELTQPRRLAREAARSAHLAAARSAELVLAVNEVATNTLRHGPGRGTLRIWATAAEIVCELHDTGSLADPLVGRRLPPPSADSGRGLYIAHHTCDLVEIGRTRSGTTIRLHVNR